MPNTKPHGRLPLVLSPTMEDRLRRWDTEGWTVEAMRQRLTTARDETGRRRLCLRLGEEAPVPHSTMRGVLARLAGTSGERERIEKAEQEPNVVPPEEARVKR